MFDNEELFFLSKSNRMEGVNVRVLCSMVILNCWWCIIDVVLFSCFDGGELCYVLICFFLYILVVFISDIVE